MLVLFFISFNLLLTKFYYFYYNLKTQKQLIWKQANQ